MYFIVGFIWGETISEYILYLGLYEERRLVNVFYSWVYMRRDD